MTKLPSWLNELKACDKIIENLRFNSMDQNPFGVRDRLWCAIAAAERDILQRKLDENLPHSHQPKQPE